METFGNILLVIWAIGAIPAGICAVMSDAMDNPRDPQPICNFIFTALVWPVFVLVVAVLVTLGAIDTFCSSKKT